MEHSSSTRNPGSHFAQSLSCTFSVPFQYRCIDTIVFEMSMQNCGDSIHPAKLVYWGTHPISSGLAGTHKGKQDHHQQPTQYHHVLMKISRIAAFSSLHAVSS
eukprot:c18805_g1_i4.p1 GENE.c18805_g1_i4~~c18805_g1_i4.p1  ORF type:complete len:103 (+),score=11.06 c18805_g1_i4:256-564(+)